MHYLAREYQWKHRQPLTVHAISHLLSTQLYLRRHFPYYSFCVLGGLDTSGVGAVYRYDSIGSFERAKVYESIGICWERSFIRQLIMMTL